MPPLPPLGGPASSNEHFFYSFHQMGIVFYLQGRAKKILLLTTNTCSVTVIFHSLSLFAPAKIFIVLTAYFGQVIVPEAGCFWKKRPGNNYFYSYYHRLKLPNLGIYLYYRVSQKKTQQIWAILMEAVSYLLANNYFYWNLQLLE